MKIMTDDAVYVQKNDLAYLNQTDLPIPASIFMKVFGSGVVIINNSNKYEFVKFDAPLEIEYFKGIDWMIDYNEVKDLSEEETTALGQSIAEEKNRIAQKFNSMSLKERNRNMDLVFQCELLDFKLCSLRDILFFKQGHIKMELPEMENISTEIVQEKGIKKLIKTIFDKKKH